MRIYIDSDFKCHVTDPDGKFQEVETDFFDGKCDAYIEGYRFVPSGESWTSEDGTVFTGEMIVPWKSYTELDVAQYEYELEQISKYSSALSEIEVAIASDDAMGTLDTFAGARKEAIITRINDMITALTTMEVEPIEE